MWILNNVTALVAIGLGFALGTRVVDAYDESRERKLADKREADLTKAARAA